MLKLFKLFKQKIKKGEKPKKEEKVSRKRRLRLYLNKAGIEIQSDEVVKKIFRIAIIINLLLSAILLYYFSNRIINWIDIALSIFFIWVIIFFLIIFLEWIIVYTIIDLRIYKRKLELEEVLPDFLQLASSNIRAGMTIDKSLWYAVRPRFGILAKEIEIVAKETMGGASLKSSLREFSDKYDSAVLKRTMSMLIEGIESGGEIGDILNKIANNLQEQRIMMKEVSANVTTYAIFITFAAIVAAPFLFALSGALIEVIHSLESSLGIAAEAAAGTLPLSFTGVGITSSNFKIFSVASIVITSLFSSMIIASIKKGNVKSGIKYMPIFIIVALAIYFLAVKVSNLLLGIVF